MLYPHLRFAAYLLAQKLPLDKYIKGLPIPDINAVSARFPGISKRATWLEKTGVHMLQRKHPDAQMAYALWQNAETRAFLMLCILREETPFAILKEHYRVDMSDYAWQIFKSVFMCLDGWDLLDIKEYAGSLSGQDQEAVDLFLAKKTWTYTQDRLGIRPRELDHGEILHSMFMKAYRKFEETDDLSYGKFALSIQKELRDVKNQGKRDALAGVRMVLESFDPSKSYVTLEELRRSSPLTETPSPEADPS